MDKDLLLSVLSREIMVDICKKFKVRVDGFQKNLDRAQVNRLGSALKTSITNAELRKKRKGGITPVEIEEIIDFLYQKTVTQYPYVTSMIVEELIEETEQNPDFSNYQGLVVFYKQFPDLYKEKLDVIMHNRENKEFLFKDVSEVKEIPIIDKINGVIYSSYEKTTILQELKTYQNQIESRDPKAIEEFKGKLIEGTEKEFFEQLRITKKEFQKELIIAFLMMDENYQNKNYFQLVLDAILEYNKISNKILSTKVRNLEEKNNDLVNQLEKQDKEIERIKQIEEEHKKIQKNYSTLKKQYDKILETKKTAEMKSTKCEPFMHYFTQLGLKNNILIVTNESNQFIDTPFESFLYGCSELIKGKKQKDITRVEGKHLFITRVSFKSTPEWLGLTKYLEKNNITYTELSGYSLTDYIEEISTVLNRKELNAYDYYV